MSAQAVECGGCAPPVVIDSAQPVDVLAVLDAEIARETEGSFVFPRGRKVAEARAAIAELIDAEREVDAAYAEFPPVGAERAAIDRGAARVNEALNRRRAALSRVQGGQQ